MDTPMSVDADSAPMENISIESSLPELGYEVLEGGNITYRWQINSWEAASKEANSSGKIYSPVFSCGGSEWRIMIFPKGNNQQGVISAFLENVEAPMKKGQRWHLCVQFLIGVTNKEQDIYQRNSCATHRYTPNETDWGFNVLVKLSDIQTPAPPTQSPSLPARAILENDSLAIVACVRVLKDPTGVLWHNFIDYDSKIETGRVGIKNQGATCYMNSLLQSLYFTNFFRRATFKIPTETDDPCKSIALSLQRIFYNLQFSDSAVGTTELTKSFGWDTADSFMQHDVQEFNRVLQDNLESKMKSSDAEGAITKLFVGQMKSFIKCINVDYESSRVEDFYDIQLNVKGCKNITDSFKEYVAVETMDGENRYHAEGHGLQDATKGVIFKSYPPVLHIQLKRFEYDMYRDAMVKINDRHEYPSEIDLDEFIDPEFKTNVPQKYKLHGVLVHTGDLHAGHYCAFIRPEKDGKWYKFDDDRVTHVTEKEVYEDNFGGETVNVKTGGKTKRFTNAYMLVYIRVSDIDEMLAPVTEQDIPRHIREAMERERVAHDQKVKERQEQMYQCVVKVIDDDLIKSHEESDMWNFDTDEVPATFKCQKNETLAKFKESVEQHFCVESDMIRLWPLVARHNRTLRLDQPILANDYNLTMEQICQKYAKTQSHLKLYLERHEVDLTNQQGQIVPFLPKEEVNSSIVILLKYYDPATQRLSYVCKRTIRNKNKKISMLNEFLCDLQGFPQGTPLRIYEEVKPTMIDLVNTQITFAKAELGDGDILCFQKELNAQEVATYGELAYVDKYYEMLQNRILVTFQGKIKDDKDPRNRFELQLSRKMKYDEVAKRVAEKVGVDAFHLRFSYQFGNKSTDIKRNSDKTTLQEMLPTYMNQNQPVVLLFSLSEIAITEFETKKLMIVTVVQNNLKELGPFDMMVLKELTVGQFLEEVIQKAGLTSSVHASALRLCESNHGRYYRVFDFADPISVVAENAELFVEHIMPEECGLDEVLMNAYRFSKNPSYAHVGSFPFRVKVCKGEMFSELKGRLQLKLGLNEKDFAKVKFYHAPERYNNLKAFEDDDILSDLALDPNDYLGIDTLDRSGKRQVLSPENKAIKIHN